MCKEPKGCRGKRSAVPYAGERTYGRVKIIDRYMVKGFLSPFAWCLFIFTIMAIIIDIFSFIEDIVKFKIPGTALAAFYIYYSPKILLQVTPMAVLLSTIFVLSNLNKNNEITAMKSSGISLWRIMSPVIILGLIISISSFIVSDKVIPISSRVANMIRPRMMMGDMMRHRLMPLDFIAVISLFLFRLLNTNIVERRTAIGVTCSKIVGE